MKPLLFTNRTLPAQLSALPNVYDQQPNVLDITQDSMIDLFDAILVNHPNGPGWTKEFSATNKAAYRTAGGNQRYLRLYDDPSDDDFRVDVRMYESMTDVDTGVNETPAGGNSWWYKSGISGGDASDWIILCDDRFMYYMVSPQNYSSVKDQYLIYPFGDTIPLNPSSAYLCCLISSDYTSSAIYSSSAQPFVSEPISQDQSRGNRHILRGADNTGSNRRFRLGLDYSTNKTLYIHGINGWHGPASPVTGEIDISRVSLAADAGSHSTAVSALMPGVHSIRQDYKDASLLNGKKEEYLAGSGDFAGTDFILVAVGHSTAPDGPLPFSLSEWR